jgi:RNA-directed DNA polymerase
LIQSPLRWALGGSCPTHTALHARIQALFEKLDYPPHVAGTLARAAERFPIQVAAIALKENFRINTHKTKLMRTGTRQKITCGVVNAHPNVQRSDYDKLKAILSNCVRHGPVSQNHEHRPDYRACLAGKISYVEMINAHHARKLQRLSDAIVWPN